MSQDFLTDAFIRLRQRLRVFSGRIIADSAGAEDILQDSFVRLWRGQYPLRSEKEAEESVHGKGESISCFFKGSTIL